MDLILKQNLSIEQKEEYKKLFKRWIKREDRLLISEKMGITYTTVHLYLTKLVGNDLVFNYAIEIAKKREAEFMQELHKVKNSPSIS